MKVSAATKVLAVVGDPVSHSLSPLMHNGWIADHGLDAVYVALLLRSNDAMAAIRAMRDFGFAGLNVTVPHKAAAAQAADVCAHATANTLVWRADGSLVAHNTDGPGFLAGLDEIAPDWRARVKHVLILGAGGAGEGIGKALSPLVETVTFANRTRARAQAAAAALNNGQALGWDGLERGFASADLIVQATTLGMAGQPAMDWPVSACQPSAIVADIVYRPLETPLLKAARDRGLRTMGGLAMLIHQGALAFELWFGVKPDAAKARQRLEAALA